MESTVGGHWGTAFHGLQGLQRHIEPPRSPVIRKQIHLSPAQYKEARQIIEAQAALDRSIEETKELLDSKGLKIPDKQCLLHIRRIYKEVHDELGIVRRTRTSIPADIRDEIEAFIERSVLAGMSNPDVYKALGLAGLGGYYARNYFYHKCKNVRKEYNLPRARYTWSDGRSVKGRRIVSAKEDKQQLVTFWTSRAKELLQIRSNLNRSDLEYVVEKVAGMKDERLKECIATLIGWGDDERAELETFVAIALDVMKQASPYKLRKAATDVELRYRTKQEEV